MRQGLTPAHFTAQLEDLRDTSLTLELNLSTFATHRRDGLGWVIWGTMSGKGQSKLKLSGNGNECKPLISGPSGAPRDGNNVLSGTPRRQRISSGGGSPREERKVNSGTRRRFNGLGSGSPVDKNSFVFRTPRRQQLPPDVAAHYAAAAAPRSRILTARRGRRGGDGCGEGCEEGKGSGEGYQGLRHLRRRGIRDPEKKNVCLTPRPASRQPIFSGGLASAPRHEENTCVVSRQRRGAGRQPHASLYTRKGLSHLISGAPSGEPISGLGPHGVDGVGSVGSGGDVWGRGLPSSTFLLNVSASCGIGMHVGVVWEVFRRCKKVLWGI